MIKLFALILALSSFPAFSQEDTVSITEETLKTPAELPVQEAPVEELPVEESMASDSTEEKKSEEVVEQVEVAPAVVSTPVAIVTPTLKTEKVLEEEKTFKTRASHWVTTFTFENSQYELFPDNYSFSGKKDFESEKHQLWGGRLGFGGEIYLGWGFVTRSMIEGYYHGTLFSQVLNGGDYDSDVKFAYTKKTGQLLGGDASQSFGWMFDLKTVNPFTDEMTYLSIETFVEAGIGKGWAYNKLNYSYDLDTTDERFNIRVRDDLLNARVGAGINMTSNQGFFLSLKATINRYEITQRKINGYIQENGNPQTSISEKPENAKIDPVVIYTLGGGYKF
jgi:hypothetical protein